MEINFQQQQFKPIWLFNLMLVSPCNTHTWDEPVLREHQEFLWDQGFPNLMQVCPWKFQES